MPVDKTRYPKSWPAISRRIRERDDWRCKFCGIEQYAMRNGSKIVLTVAHLHDPDPMNCEDDNLAALCQRCHTRLDAKMHAEHSVETKRLKAAIARMRANALLTEVIYKEPRVWRLIDEAMKQKNTPGYNRIRTYYALKAQAETLVGWMSRNRDLDTMWHYDAVILTISDLLPPDAADKANCL